LGFVIVIRNIFIPNLLLLGIFAMSIGRLPQLEKNLRNLYAQLAAGEDGVVGVISKIDKVKYQQEIEDEIWPQIRKFENELFVLLQQESRELTFGEADAQATIDVIAQEMSRVRLQPDLSAQVLMVLERIETKLNEPGVTADAKLKGTLSVFPPFIGLAYEGQIDTENFCRKYFPTFTRLIKGAKK
jgi:hypothetical protein